MTDNMTDDFRKLYYANWLYIYYLYYLFIFMTDKNKI